ncbi:MAG: RteC domain-containing protein [Candidatus Pedobacter colombiensis]|uniref:RteC domain-containing protein n=1 Tax=Candidatus Pedobacter colombiensis TaxID=3121371 RepID=A0AAJ5W6A2_9SPHI|nr:RteC domain-containing protein [Pedobacter sp.]WEK17908.1 MAG: RteC domain-containing protein [Pedobacter sp.]
MEKLSKDLLSRMHNELQVIAIESENPLQMAERSFYLADATVKELKDTITPQSFKGKEQEIKFFKEIKPLFQKELIYYQELFYYEASKPFGNEKATKGYLSEVMKRIQSYFDKNRYLYNYHQTGSNRYDDDFFLRQSERLPLQPISTIDLDLDFSTPYSTTLAKLLAYEQLRDYLLNSEFNTANSNLPNSTEAKELGLVWSDSKAALIELAYAIYAKGSVNFGKASIKQIVTGLEFTFNVQLGNFYRTYLDLLLRKKKSTPYLDGLKDFLLIYMEESVDK